MDKLNQANDLEHLIDLAIQMERSGATTDAKLVRKAIDGLSYMHIGAHRLEIIAAAVRLISEKYNDPGLVTLADTAKEWGERMREMATGKYSSLNATNDTDIDGANAAD